MEQNLPIIVTKKLWNRVRLAFFMLRKGTCKKKILLDINLLMKRGKIAAKVAALNNLIFHHNHHHVSASQGGVGALSGNLQSGGLVDASREYELSCKNSPLYRHYFNNNKAKNNNDHHYLKSSPNFKDQFEYEAVNKVLDSMLSNNKHTVIKQRQLSITESPFLLQNENQHVDAAADDFIKRFYSQLKQQQDC